MSAIKNTNSVLHLAEDYGKRWTDYHIGRAPIHNLSLPLPHTRTRTCKCVVRLALLDIRVAVGPPDAVRGACVDAS